MGALYDALGDVNKKLISIKLMRRALIAVGGIAGYTLLSESQYEAMSETDLDAEAAELFAAVEVEN